MKRASIVILTLASKPVKGIPIMRECVSKLSGLAGAEKDGSTDFDWTDQVLKKYNSESVPVLKRSCLAENGDLNSFRIVLKGYDPWSNIVSDTAGPSEFGSCGNKPAPV